MATPNLAIGEQHGPTTPQAQSFTRALMGNMQFNEAEIEAPRYKVYLYTVSKREFIVEQAPLVPRLTIPACAAEERYKIVTEIPHPMYQVERHPDRNEAIVYRHDAQRVAMSLCNPTNPTLNQDHVVQNPLASGVNLSAQGVFWSLSNPPEEKEIQAAFKRREKYYASLLEQARQLEVVNPKELESLLNQDFHMAAEYFAVETPWHRKFVSKAECPNCGEPIKSANLAYHVNSLGMVCVIDRERASAALVGQEQSSPDAKVEPARPESPAAKRTRREMPNQE